MSRKRKGRSTACQEGMQPAAPGRDCLWILPWLSPAWTHLYSNGLTLPPALLRLSGQLASSWVCPMGSTDGGLETRKEKAKVFLLFSLCHGSVFSMAATPAECCPTAIPSASGLSEPLDSRNTISSLSFSNRLRVKGFHF